MLTDGVVATIPTGATVNVALSRPLEFVGTPSVLRRYLAVADAPGLLIQMLINVGGNQMVPISNGTSVNAAAAPGQGPKDDEDGLASDVPLPAGARTQINVTNTTVGDIIFRDRATLAP